MSAPDYNVRREAARLGGMYSYGQTPDPEQEAEARRSLATARIDREIRQAFASKTRFLLDDAQARHLVGLILSNAGVKYDTAMEIENAVRTAVLAAQQTEA